MTKSLLLAGVMLAAAGTAVAQPASPRPDRDAPITRAQVLERADRMFARLDVNNDGRATPAEAQQARERRRTEAQGRHFERLDANRDGSISRAEFDQALAQRGERRMRRPGGPGGPGMRHGMRGPRPGMRGPGGPGGARQDLFQGQDWITRDQLRERALQRFARMDLNNDGTATAEERRESHRIMRTRIMEQRRGGQQDTE